MLWAVGKPDGSILAHARDLEQARSKAENYPGALVLCTEHPALPFRRYRHLSVVPTP